VVTNHREWECIDLTHPLRVEREKVPVTEKVEVEVPVTKKEDEVLVTKKDEEVSKPHEKQYSIYDDDLDNMAQVLSYPKDEDVLDVAPSSPEESTTGPVRWHD